MNRGLLEVRRCAETILTGEVDPVVRFRLLRDVLGVGSSRADWRAARAAALKSRWVAELAAEQRPDGSWGRFHSVDTRLAQKNGTTEAAVARAISLGLDRRHPILKRGAGYIAAVLPGRATIPDHAERNERWPTGVRLFAASTLAQIDRRHPALRPVCDLWCEIACATFASGEYDADAEAAAHRRLTGITGELRYLHIRNVHAVRLLGTRSQEIPLRVQTGLLKSVFGSPRAMTYTAADLRRPPDDPKAVARVVSALEVIADLRPWCRFAKPFIQWLWSIRGSDGLWDFPGGSRVRPLSASWRQKDARRNDSSVRILALLRRYYAS